jgi:hypothetical protein
MEKEQDHTASDKSWRKLRAPLPRPNPLHHIFAWSVGIGIALLFLWLVLYAWLVYHR